MPSPALTRLLALVPPPRAPSQSRGDRAAVRRVATWDVPDHVFEVTEAYGAVAWLDWLQTPSLFSGADREDLGNRTSEIAQVTGGAPSLVAYSDPEGAFVFIGRNGLVSVKSPEGVVETRLPLADVLLSWLGGKEHFGLGPADVPGGHPAFAVPIFDADREARVTWLMVRPGRRSWPDRWAAVCARLGPRTLIGSQLTGEPVGAAAYFEGLELKLSANSMPVAGGLEQWSLQHYGDRADAVKAALAPAMANAGMSLVRVEGPRGVAKWWPVTDPA